jgi:hypothetical protein
MFRRLTDHFEVSNHGILGDLGLQERTLSATNASLDPSQMIGNVRQPSLVAHSGTASNSTCGRSSQ